MAVRRRPRGSLKHPVAVGYVIEEASKEKLDGMARNAGVSSALMLELMLSHTDLTIQGVPTWFERPSGDGELPIDSR